MILVTGHKGFIGRKLYEKMGGGFGIDLREGQNLLTCELPKGISVIYHLAAQSDVVASWKDPMHDMDNLRMTVRLVKEYPKAKIVYASSAATFTPILSPYGFSKWACAEYLKIFHENYVICVLPNIYGEESRSVVDIFKEKESVIVYGDGKQTRDYVHVDDIVQGLFDAQFWSKGEYQLGSGIATSVLELARGKKITFAPQRKEAFESVLKNNTPNWKPKINIHEYLS